ncbi:lipopolysaccharide transport system ATP-binding protein [Algoriphagus ornithinivorans]|uniref:Lipopolysaccharide transport system ATP-binding protein n=1 Tax=Algoriphagus ornithinivorans TaxID=226506 RepID=A0A1I5HID2_9BACT|nr:ABC transporter ATP-binding protein [Algoriphagus ornithinivorans]SFO48054.1 lipopolysaccharide transport system ATP-binding protein [Algoriphagus ornithinivorans]
MSDTIIKVENLSKRYRIGLKEKKADTFAQQLINTLKAPIENFRRIKSLGKFEDESDSVHWALKDVSFEVKQGEVLGIIGKNGAGKSTLLKILSKITEPTSGRIEMHGRVAALLEVGTGFHPELTGRENIYMNGTILGMTKKEIDRKLEEIIDFSGVEKYIDTPVKFYSSGMRVRLGFSVAAHLEPEILIIDEVLSVGDYEFQQRCLGKMGEVSKYEGRTVLFVSHNMSAVKELCPNSLILNNGNFLKIGKTSEVLKLYSGKTSEKIFSRIIENQNYDVIVNMAYIENSKEDLDSFVTLFIQLSSNLEISVALDIRLKTSDLQMPVGFGSMGTFDQIDQLKLIKGQNNFEFNIDTKTLAIGEYLLSIDITKPFVKYYDRCEDCISFEILKPTSKHKDLLLSWNYGANAINITSNV